MVRTARLKDSACGGVDRVLFRFWQAVRSLETHVWLIAPTGAPTRDEFSRFKRPPDSVVVGARMPVGQ